ncbi:hypothetical protein WA026_000570, partial [Henosepilachna vigintioctopunctata]
MICLYGDNRTNVPTNRCEHVRNGTETGYHRVTIARSKTVLGERRPENIDDRHQKIFKTTKKLNKKDKDRKEQNKLAMKMDVGLENETMDNNRQVKRTYKAKVQTKRKKGRQRQTWNTVLSNIIQERGKSWKDTK